MHWSDTRLAGVLGPLVLALNKMRAGGETLERFDSWVMRFTRAS
jgi:hypothetical protein